VVSKFSDSAGISTLGTRVYHSTIEYKNNLRIVAILDGTKHLLYDNKGSKYSGSVPST